MSCYVFELKVALRNLCIRRPGVAARLQEWRANCELLELNIRHSSSTQLPGTEQRRLLPQIGAGDYCWVKGLCYDCFWAGRITLRARRRGNPRNSLPQA